MVILSEHLDDVAGCHQIEPWYPLTIVSRCVAHHSERLTRPCLPISETSSVGALKGVRDQRLHTKLVDLPNDYYSKQLTSSLVE